MTTQLDDDQGSLQLQAQAHGSDADTARREAPSADPAPSLLAAPSAALGAGVVQRRIARRVAERSSGDRVLQRKPEAGTGEQSGGPTSESGPTGGDEIPLPKGLTEADVAAAAAAAEKDKLGPEAIKQLQELLGAPSTGTYDRATVIAAFNKQTALGFKYKGKPTKDFFARIGLIYTHKIENAGVEDAQLAEVKKLYPSGVTVGVYSRYDNQNANNAEITNRANQFTREVKAVGAAGGKITIGGDAVPIREVGQIVETVQSIHRGLLEKSRQSSDGGGDETMEKKGAEGAPAFTRVKNLAIFSHGMEYGVSTDAGGSYAKGLHSDPLYGNESNIKSFVKGISDAITSDIGVQLYACNTGHDKKKSGYEEWVGHKQGERTGEGSFADDLANELGPDANVYGHTTAGHATENFAARVFGKDAGGEGGLHMFDVMYDETFIQAELGRLYADKSDEERPLYHDGLREQMWSHFKDSISNEHSRTGKNKQYSVPIGREMFYNPANAKALLHENWSSVWIPSRLKSVKPSKKPTTGGQGTGSGTTTNTNTGTGNQTGNQTDQGSQTGGSSGGATNGGTTASRLGGSVGEGGDNREADVRLVQTQLKARGFDPGPIDGDIGRLTIAAIRRFQATIMPRPDGRIDPGGRTETALFGAGQGSTGSDQAVA